VRDAIRDADGTDLRALAIINGWSARVPADQIEELGHAPGVTAVTADRTVQLAGNTYDPAVSASPYAWTSQAAPVWSSADQKGDGVSVAVLDTGVSDIQDLSGRVMHGPDLSGENNNAVDSMGHGTVMAGIIGGDGSAAGAAAPRTGIAPEVDIISVKVAGANGATDVSTMIAGMSWVGAFKDVYRIKVLNLSWGVPSTQNPTIDPVNFAVEMLWRMGVVVVVAAGNTGPTPGSILKPGDDPLVITVGAFDDKGDTVAANDSIPAWSSQGPTSTGLAKPDVVASGRTLIVPRAPGSVVEQFNPNALVAPAYIRASGTSEATAVTSGVAALLLAEHPLWTPDQVKHALKSTASKLPNVAASLQGSGRIQAQAAMSASVLLAPVQVSAATGLGSLEASRGSSPAIYYSSDGQVVELTGEMTAWCAPWTSGAWTSGAWTSGAWTSGAWTSGAWTSGAWTSGAWTGAAWSSGAWTSGAWTSGAWTSGAWTSGAWTSGEYLDDPSTPSTFQTVFYGAHPKYGKKVKGEISDPKPSKTSK
jgi:serine protease AprX